MAYDIGAVIAHVQADLSGFSAGIAQAKAQADSLGERVGGVMENVRSFAEQAGAVVAGQAIGFGLLAKQAIDVASNFEQTQTSFGTLLGSEQKAADLMKQLMQFEQKTPFDIETLTTAAKQMLAFGVNSKSVVPIMSELTDMSQGQASKLNELVSIYGQVNSIQQLNGREVLRLSSIGVPIYQAIEDHFKKIGQGANMTGEEVKKMVEKGKISATVFNQVLSEMTGKGGMFYQENIRQMSTFSGILSSTKSQIQYAILNLMGIDIGAANEVRKGGLFDTLRNLASELLGWLHQLQPVFDQIGKNKTFQAAIEGFVIALASLAIIIPIVILALNPVVLAVAAIEAAIVLLYIAWSTNFGGIRDITKSVVTEVMNFFNNYLKPLFVMFAAYWQMIWPFLSSYLKLEWDLMVGILKVAWDLFYGILKIGIDLLTGNWSKAWQDIKQIVVTIWDDVTGILNTGLSFIGKWGGQVLSALTKPFSDAWNAITGTVNKIKDALDFTKRHSPSVLDIVQSGVAKVNAALTGISFTPDMTTGQIGNSILSPLSQIAGNSAAGGPQITINMQGAIVPNTIAGTQIGEEIGNAIIRKLGYNIRH